MKKLVELALENHSTKDVFLFRVACSNCGTEYANKPVRFSKAGITPPTEGKRIVFEACYEQELQSARLSAIRDAVKNLNYCPICKRLVCNQCFLICEELDMCRVCAERLHVEGTPVGNEVFPLEIIPAYAASPLAAGK